MNLKLYWQHKRVLITGGTSGLGKALAVGLTQQGAKVSILARGTEGLQALRREHPQIHAIQGDVGRKEDIHRIYAEAITQLGHIDVLINNASTLGATPLRPLLDTDCETLEKTLQANLVGPFRLSKLALAGMLLNGAGIVINISSDAAVGAYPTWGAYGASKAALDHLTRIFQVELENTGIHFLAVDPGEMNTPMHQAAIPDADPTQLLNPSTVAEQMIVQIAEQRFTPVRRSLL